MSEVTTKGVPENGQNGADFMDFADEKRERKMHAAAGLRPPGAALVSRNAARVGSDGRGKGRAE